MNSLYGAFGNAHFRYYVSDIAEAITLTGQLAVSTAREWMNNYLRGILGPNYKNHDFVVAGDTDSVSGDSIIRVNGKEMTIAEFYDLANGEEETRPHGGTVKHLKGSLWNTPSVDMKTGEVKTRQINYAMRHKTKKRMYRIHLDDGSSVDVTQDHSAIVKRDGVLMEVKPTEVVVGDIVLKNDNDETIDTFVREIEDLGETELDVYDLEVDDTHTFFANDILVHNSIHVCLKPLVDTIFKGVVPEDKHKVTDILDKISKQKLNGVLEDGFEHMARWTGCFRNTMNMKREKICPSSIYVKKKHYALAILDSEGVRYEKPDIMIKGMVVIKSTTPKHCRDAFREAFQMMLLGKESQLKDFVGEFETRFKKMTPEEVGRVSGTSEFDEYADSNSIYKKGTPGHIKAALIHNHMIKSKGLEKDYETINPGDTIKYLHLYEPNPTMDKVVGFKGELPKELGLHKYIDYNTQFAKVFMDPLTRITDVIGWKVDGSATLDDFFS